MEINDGDLKQGILGLVVTLVEVIRDALRHQAVRRMETGSLTDVEIERLGKALLELDNAIELIKDEMGIAEAVKSVRDGLDKVVDDLIADMVSPPRALAGAREGALE